MRVWWNWNTQRSLKPPLPDRDCGFKSHHPHSLYAFARSATGLGFSLRRKLAEVLASALRCDAAALVPHDRSSGPAALLQQIIGERKGRTQQFKASRGSVLGKGLSCRDENVGFGEQILEGL